MIQAILVFDIPLPSPGSLPLAPFPLHLVDVEVEFEVEFEVEVEFKVEAPGRC